MYTNHKYARKKTFLLLLIIFIVLTVLTGFSYNIGNFYDNTSNISSEYKENPRASANEIVLLTPINKTYSNPNKGYFLGTYGFENDVLGSIPSGWTDLSDPTCSVNITDEYNKHSRSLQLYHASGSNKAKTS